MNEFVKENKEAEKAEKKQQREDNDIKKLLTYVEFRRFIWRILTFTGMYRTSFTGNSSTFLNEGKRMVGLYLLGSVMRANKMAFAQLQQEFYSEATSEELIKQKEDLNKEII